MNRTITLLVSIACAGCDALFGLIPVTASATMCEGCTDSGTGTDIDASADGHGSNDPMLDAGSGSYQDAQTASTFCHPMNAGLSDSCDCIYDGSGCVAGAACTLQGYISVAASCDYAGTAAVGTSCKIDPTVAADVCVPGAWCAWGPNTHSTLIGTCRQICDPHDASVVHCAGAQVCMPMLQCANGNDYPNCPPDPNTRVGYCQ